MEDTEWNDILREKGIIPEKPKEAEISEDTILEWIDKALHEKEFGKAVEDRNLAELDELEDIEDDEVLESYRRQRMNEMKQQKNGEVYSGVLNISKVDWARDVTDASKKCYVVVLLHQESIPDCKLVSAILDRLSSKYPSVKFTKIKADLCIPDYPDRNTPTLLIYHEGDLKKQIVGITGLGGRNASVVTVEDALKMTGALKVVSSTWTQDEEDDGEGKRFSFNRVNKGDRHKDDSDDE